MDNSPKESGSTVEELTCPLTICPFYSWDAVLVSLSISVVGICPMSSGIYAVKGKRKGSCRKWKGYTEE